jgi:hypothetical protein
LYRLEIIANHSVEENILDAFADAGVAKFYTRYAGVYGVGTSGPRMGDAVWPEENFVLTIWCDEEEVWGIQKALARVKQQFPGEGIKMFGFNVDDLSMPMRRVRGQIAAPTGQPPIGEVVEVPSVPATGEPMPTTGAPMPGTGEPMPATGAPAEPPADPSPGAPQAQSASGEQHDTRSGDRLPYEEGHDTRSGGSGIDFHPAAHSSAGDRLPAPQQDALLSVLQQMTASLARVEAALSERKEALPSAGAGTEPAGVGEPAEPSAPPAPRKTTRARKPKAAPTKAAGKSAAGTTQTRKVVEPDAPKPRARKKQA